MSHHTWAAAVVPCVFFVHTHTRSAGDRILVPNYSGHRPIDPAWESQELVAGGTWPLAAVSQGVYAEYRCCGLRTPRANAGDRRTGLFTKKGYYFAQVYLFPQRKCPNRSKLNSTSASKFCARNFQRVPRLIASRTELQSSVRRPLDAELVSR
jgi:hypothetical protein